VNWINIWFQYYTNGPPSALIEIPELSSNGIDIFYSYILLYLNIRNSVRDHALHLNGFQISLELRAPINVSLRRYLKPALNHLKQLDTFSYDVWTFLLRVLESGSLLTHCAGHRHGHDWFVAKFCFRFHMCNNLLPISQSCMKIEFPAWN